MGLKNRLFSLYFPESIAASSIRKFSFSSGIVLIYHEVLPDEVNNERFSMVDDSIVEENPFKTQHAHVQSCDIQASNSWIRLDHGSRDVMTQRKETGKNGLFTPAFTAEHSDRSFTIIPKPQLMQVNFKRKEDKQISTYFQAQVDFMNKSGLPHKMESTNAHQKHYL